jgi:hypothetical protein
VISFVVWLHERQTYVIMNTHVAQFDIGSTLRRPLVFLSYAYADREHRVYQRFVRDLKNDGRIRLWDGFEEIRVGDSAMRVMQEAIEKADFHLYIVAPTEARGNYTKQEMYLGYAHQLRKQRATIIPVLIDDREIPDILQTLPCVDLTENYQRALHELMELLVNAGQQPIADFELDTVGRDRSIMEVTGIVGAKLVEYFARHPDELKSMDRRKFEELVAELFSGFGYEVELTKQTRDGGRDVIAIARREIEVKYLIECKRPDPGGYVGIRPVRELYGVKCDEKATKAILATTAYFSPDALLFFENHKWEMEPRDYDGLLEWIADYMNRRYGQSAS